MAVRVLLVLAALAVLNGYEHSTLDAATRDDGDAANDAVVRIMQRVDLALDDHVGI